MPKSARLCLLLASAALYLSACSGSNAVPAASNTAPLGRSGQMQSARGAAAGTLETLYVFSGRGHGRNPNSPLVKDQQGNYYGSTQRGGVRSDAGLVFELKPNGAIFSESILHEFSQSDPLGHNPGALVADAAGNLFGQSSNGVFELVRPSSGNAWQGTLVHQCTHMPADPRLTVVGKNIFGACGDIGSINFGESYIFELTPSGSGYTDRIIYTFPVISHGDDVLPSGGLVADASGVIYGTSYGYGGNCCSDPYFTYSLTPGPGGYTETNLFNSNNVVVNGPALGRNGEVFQSAYYYQAQGGPIEAGVPGSSGYNIKTIDVYLASWKSSPILDATGHVYVATGNRILKYAPAQSGYFESIVYRFPATYRVNQLTIDETGELYGTTEDGGSTACGGRGCGTFFRLKP